LLGPGLHAATIELAVRGRGREPHGYRVRLSSGRSLTARLAAGVSPRLVEECMRETRSVVVCDGPNGVTIAGALQTAPSLSLDERGALWLDADRIRLCARKSLALEVAGSAITLADGALRVEGDRLVIDAAALVRILSAKVEIP
jgi:hypothetical protein